MQLNVEPEVTVSAVTVTWNGKQFAHTYLKSIAEVDVPGLEIIVVDNNSSDGTPEFIAQAYPNVKLIRNNANLGFAKATNIGIEASKGRYICLINSDVVLVPGCLNQLLRQMEDEEYRAVGLIAPQMLGVTGVVQRSTMRFPTLLNTGYRALALDRIRCSSRLFRGQLMSDFGHDHACDVEVLNGWFWMVRREALEEVGGLDERFFIYGEDIDWCLRFWKKGWRVHFFPEATAIHYGEASSSVAPGKFYMEMQKANLQYWLKHHSGLSYRLYYCLVCVHHLLRVLGHFCFAVIRWDERTVHASKAKRSWAALAWLLSPKNSECIT